MIFIRNKFKIIFIILTGIAAAFITVCYSNSVTPSQFDIKNQTGRWRITKYKKELPALSSEQSDEIQKLESLGYLSGSKIASERKGVTVYDRERAYQGYNLYSSGQAPEAYLMDMEGNIVHRWSHAIPPSWVKDVSQQLGKNKTANAHSFRRVRLLKNGELLAIFEGFGIIKLDKNSRLIWSNNCQAHHDIKLMPDGSIVTLTREVRIHPEMHKKKPVLEDYVTWISSDGRIVRRISLIDALLKSEFRYLIDRIPHKAGDLLHTNAVYILDGRSNQQTPAFRKNNLLISVREVDSLLILDPELEKIVWVNNGPYKKQHDPLVLDNGNILLFDNQGAEEYSRVLEIEPSSGKIVWNYSGSRDKPFYSEFCGISQRLNSGNTLITESDNGRAFEATNEGEIVWEFISPYRAGEKNEYVATLFLMERIDFSQLDWLEK